MYRQETNKLNMCQQLYFYGIMWTHYDERQSKNFISDLYQKIGKEATKDW